MKFSEELGLALSLDLRELLEKGGHKAGGVSAFCAACHIPASSYHFWTGNGKRKAEYITWDTWERVRNALAQLRLLDPADPRWMLPSELRAELLRLRAIVAAGSPTTISAGDGAAVANGSHASASAAGTQTPPSPAEERAAERLDRLAAWILASTLSPDEKLAALAIAHG